VARRPRILMASYFDWGSPLHLGTHNLAAAFVNAGWDVAFVATALALPQAARDWRDFKARAARYSPRGRQWMGGRLWAYMPLALLTPHNVPLLRSKLVHRNWQRLTLPNVVRTVHSRGFGEVDLLYIDSPLQAFWLSRVEHRASIARITDRNAGYLGSASQWHIMERKLVRSVDVVAHTSSGLGSELRAQGARHVVYLPNGVDIAHFVEGDRSNPPEYIGLARPIAVYVGSLDEWFDYGAVTAAAKSLPDVSFVIIGPSQHAKSKLQDCSNVILLGPRPFSELPRYLHNADIGLIPRNARSRGELVHAMHPLKLYEYMVCGLPVVATRLDELERLNSPAILCADRDSFVTAIRETLSSPPDPMLSLEFARQADWSLRVKTLLEAVSAGAS
jgi:glycosyltransferase involved in cell wall biosynthesis